MTHQSHQTEDPTLKVASDNCKAPGVSAPAPVAPDPLKVIDAALRNRQPASEAPCGNMDPLDCPAPAPVAVTPEPIDKEWLKRALALADRYARGDHYARVTLENHLFAAPGAPAPASPTTNITTPGKQ